MKRLVVWILLGAIAAMLLPVKAQDNNIPMPTDCSAETVKNILALVKQAVDATTEQIDTIAPEDAATVLQFISLYTGMLKATCDELSFKGDAQQVLGPVLIPAGIYKAVATSTAGVSMTVTPTNGQCGQGSGAILLPGLFFLSEPSGTPSAETVFTSKECEALIEVKTYGAASWTLDFEKVS